MKKQVKQQLGMTLMEVLAALAIIASVIVGSLSLFGSANSASVASQTQKDVLAIRSALQSTYGSSTSYGAAAGDDLNAVLVSANKVPSSLKVSGNTIKTAYNGEIQVKVGATTDKFNMKLTAVPKDVCVSLLTSMSSGWSKAKVGGGADITTFPVSPAAATDGTDGCAAATNDITWTTES